LEAVAKSDDVYKLRDTLLAAVKELSTPRRFLGKNSGQLMDDEVKDILKLAQQQRLRQIVFKCLKGIWESGVGGEVLRMAVDTVRSRLAQWRSRAGEDADVIQAMAGREWAQLEDLVQAIDEKLGQAHRQPLGPIEGRRTRVVIDRALDALGGKGALRDVIEWIEKNPTELEELREAKLNRNIRDGQRKPVWHSTVGSMISQFRKVPGHGPPTLYLSAAAEMPEAPPKPIEDAPQKKPRAKRPPKVGPEGDDAAQEPQPKRKRIRQADTDLNKVAAETPAKPTKKTDPLSSALDAALAAQT